MYIQNIQRIITAIKSPTKEAINLSKAIFKDSFLVAWILIIVTIPAVTPNFIPNKSAK